MDDLEGAELDRAVWIALYYPAPPGAAYPAHYKPSTNWAQGGPIIERERIELLVSGTVDSPVWLANPEIQMQMQAIESEWQGPTPLIAAMRAFVASKR